MTLDTDKTGIVTSPPPVYKTTAFRGPLGEVPTETNLSVPLLSPILHTVHHGGGFMRCACGGGSESWVFVAIRKGTLPHLSQFHLSADTSHPGLFLLLKIGVG